MSLSFKSKGLHQLLSVLSCLVLFYFLNKKDTNLWLKISYFKKPEDILYKNWQEGEIRLFKWSRRKKDKSIKEALTGLSKGRIFNVFPIFQWQLSFSIILILAITILIRFYMNQTDNSQTVQESICSFVLVRILSVLQ